MIAKSNEQIFVPLVLTFLALISRTTPLCPGSPGDVIVITRLYGLYHHYAINVGNGYLAHLTGSKNELLQCFRALFVRSGRCDKGEVKKEKCADVVKSASGVYIENGTWNDKAPLPVNKILNRTLSKVGKTGYHLLHNNCEHFVRWCRYGEEDSKQADNLMLLLYILGGIVFVTFFPLLFLVLRYNAMLKRLAIFTFVTAFMALLILVVYLFLYWFCETMIRLLTRFKDSKELEGKLLFLGKIPRPGTWPFQSGTILADILIIQIKEHERSLA